MTGHPCHQQQTIPYGPFSEHFKLPPQTTQDPQTGLVLNKAPEFSQILHIYLQTEPAVLVYD